MRVTREQLIKKNACTQMLDKFTETFGDSVTLTARRVMRHALTFGVSLNFLITDREFDKFDDLVAEFEIDFRKNIFHDKYSTNTYPLASAAAFCELRKLPLD